MASDALILGFDTSAAHCAAALLCGDHVLDSRSEPMARGQAERLMPMMEEMLTRQGLGWADLSRIGVGIGPGNFSGIRIAVSAARGLALALNIPAIGVSTFEAITVTAPDGAFPCVAAPQDQIYIALPGDSPQIRSRSEAEMSGDPLQFPPQGEEWATNIARCAAAARALFARPAPLYIRPADAAPARDAPPVILDG